MKTNMFKKLGKEGKVTKLAGIIQRKTNFKLPIDIIYEVLKNIDLDNQYKINFYDRAYRFKEACTLHDIAYECNKFYKVEEKYRPIYNENIKIVKGDSYLCTDKIDDKITTIRSNEEPEFDENEIYVFLKMSNTIYDNNTSDWFYSLQIYVPENK